MKYHQYLFGVVFWLRWCVLVDRVCPSWACAAGEGKGPVVRWHCLLHSSKPSQRGKRDVLEDVYADRRPNVYMSKNHGQSDFQVELDRGGSLARRKTELLPDGVYLFEDDLEISGLLCATIVTCSAWLLELYELQAGELFFIRGKEHVRPDTKRFGVFYPPFSITRLCFKNAKAHLLGVAATEGLPPELTITPTVFESTFSAPPNGVARVIEILRASNNRQPIEINPKASLLSLKAKRLIHESYLVYPSIARIAKRLGVTHEHLSRQFKRDFGMSPSDYLRQLRVADAPLRLARGEEIVNVSQDVGYNDLSRFYKQFRKTTDTSPGVCKTILRPKRISRERTRRPM